MPRARGRSRAGTDAGGRNAGGRASRSMPSISSFRCWSASRAARSCSSASSMRPSRRSSRAWRRTRAERGLRAVARAGRARVAAHASKRAVGEARRRARRHLRAARHRVGPRFRFRSEPPRRSRSGMRFSSSYGLTPSRKSFGYGMVNLKSMLPDGSFVLEMTHGSPLGVFFGLLGSPPGRPSRGRRRRRSRMGLSFRPVLRRHPFPAGRLPFVGSGGRARRHIRCSARRRCSRLG